MAGGAVAQGRAAVELPGIGVHRVAGVLAGEDGIGDAGGKDDVGQRKRGR